MLVLPRTQLPIAKYSIRKNEKRFLFTFFSGLWCSGPCSSLLLARKFLIYFKDSISFKRACTVDFVILQFLGFSTWSIDFLKLWKGSLKHNLLESRKWTYGTLLGASLAISLYSSWCHIHQIQISKDFRLAQSLMSCQIISDIFPHQLSPLVYYPNM